MPVTVKNPGAIANAKRVDKERDAIGTGIGTNPVSEAHNTKLFGQEANGISCGSPNATSHMPCIWGTNVGNLRAYDSSDLEDEGCPALADDDDDDN